MTRQTRGGRGPNAVSIGFNPSSHGCNGAAMVTERYAMGAQRFMTGKHWGRSRPAWSGPVCIRYALRPYKSSMGALWFWLGIHCVHISAP